MGSAVMVTVKQLTESPLCQHRAALLEGHNMARELKPSHLLLTIWLLRLLATIKYNKQFLYNETSSD